MFCALAEESVAPLAELDDYLDDPASLPAGESARWFVLDCLRQHARAGGLAGGDPARVDRFLRALPDEHQLTLIAELVEQWGDLGADNAMLELLQRVTRLPADDAVAGADAASAVDAAEGSAPR
jgi:hypothetical protein